jgi:CheY-like chemotaxis protein
VDRAPLILAVDPDPALLAFYADLLAEEGWAVAGLPAPLGPESIAALDPDLVLLELVFGGELLGIGLAAALKAHPATAHIPLVACTGLAGARERYGLQLAAWGCPLVAKPFDVEALTAAIRSALGPPNVPRLALAPPRLADSAVAVG